MNVFKKRAAIGILSTSLMLGVGVSALAQDAAAGAKSAAVRLLGTVTAVNGNTVTLKSDAGAESVVNVPDSARMVRTAPGQKDLTGATPIKAADLQIGDRVSVRATLGDDGKTYTASSLIAMSKADIAQKQQADMQDWQKRGVGGLVKSVDAGTGAITITTGGASGKTLTIHTTKTTVIRRYALDSVKFEDAKVVMLAQIKQGDQLRARGAKSEDGSEITADEILTGTFRNVAGLITAIDTNAGTVTVTDLATKKPVVIKVTADSQMRKLPTMMAQAIAARLKGGSGTAAGGPGAGGGPSAAGGNAAASAKPSGTAPTGAAPAGAAPTGTTPTGAASGAMAGGGRPGGGDPQQMLNRAPVIQLADLKKGDAVMVVGTEGTAADATTAVTLLAGVEPMLQASPSASQNMLLSNWSLGGGAPGGEGPQ